jgi:hypothetical protein
MQRYHCFYVNSGQRFLLLQEHPEQQPDGGAARGMGRHDRFGQLVSALGRDGGHLEVDIAMGANTRWACRPPLAWFGRSRPFT